MFLLIIVVISVLLASGMCSMTEAAILSLPLIRARILYEKKREGSTDLLYIKENIHSAVATIVILNNAINIIGAVFVGQMVSRIFGNEFLGIFSAVLTFAIIVISEVIPKTIGEHHKAGISLATARALRVLMWFFKPAVAMIRMLVKPFSAKKARPWITEEEIKMLLRLGRAAGTVEVDEETLINRVFKLNDLTAKQMMKPIGNIYAMEGDRRLEEEKNKIINSPYSRIAVYERSFPNIIGICQQRVLLKEMANDNHTARIRDFMTRPIFINENEKADGLLDKFRSYHQHLFIVKDARENNIGILTMEDTLEELFGEIYDETDILNHRREG